ncbi:sulfur transferase domain-containing protein [Dyella jiangningensis]|uniref:beta-lactamase hydrolase domain-containing protein n=1 Tax=Dyella jiangningensis TaxID=1379159 RepID=UPI0024105936|nr:sulfur transferase domain-containing protein [Dyella jiangningensis]MDG2537494.1 sulfur transferase domain-containing protein [Dyella jiangningensis]
MPGLKGSFFIAVLAGAVGVMGWAAYQRFAHPPVPRAVPMKLLADGVWVSEQIGPPQLVLLQQKHFAAVVDLRPDGEVAGQPSSSDMADAAGRAGLAFSYAPVPHGAIPEQAVNALQKALASQPRPVLLYCRSGRRAARTWALAEASRAGGLDARAITQVVLAVGQPVDDLGAEIKARIAARPSAG